MAVERVQETDPRVQKALADLRGLIHRRYPAATFEVAPGEDPEGIYLWATVDVEDTDEVADVIIDRMLEIQVEEGLPVYVIPVRPLKRVLQDLQQPRPRRRLSIDLEELVPPAVR